MINDYYEILLGVIKVFPLFLIFFYLYKFFTTNIDRLKYYRKLKIYLWYTYKISWFNQFKKASSKVLSLLNYVYGKPNIPITLIHKGYFNLQSWKASLIISAFYIFSSILVLPLVLLDDNFKPITVLVYISISLLFIFLIIFLRKKISFMNISLDIYSNSFLSLILILIALIVTNFNIISSSISAFFIFILVPIFLIIRFGPSGLLSFLLSIFIYILTLITLIYSGYANNYSDDRTHINLIFLIIIFFIYKKNKFDYKSIIKKYTLFLFLFLLLLSVYKGDDPLHNISQFFFIFYFLFMELLP